MLVLIGLCLPNGHKKASEFALQPIQCYHDCVGSVNFLERNQRKSSGFHRGNDGSRRITAFFETVPLERVPKLCETASPTFTILGFHFGDPPSRGTSGLAPLRTAKGPSISTAHELERRHSFKGGARQILRERWLSSHTADFLARGMLLP